MKVHSKKRCRLEQLRLQSLVYVMYNIKLRERNIRRRRLHIDPILIEEPASDDEWLVETEEPCLMDDIAWLDEVREEDEAREDEDRDFLDVTALGNEGTSIAVDSESREKRQRVDSCSSMDKGKGPVIDDVDETRDDIDPEDAEYILEEDDLVIIDEIRT